MTMRGRYMRSVGLTAGGAIACLGLACGAFAQTFSYNGDTGPGFWSELNLGAAEAMGVEPDCL